MFVHGALCFHIQHWMLLLKTNGALEHPSLLGCNAVPIRTYRRFEDRCVFKTPKTTWQPTLCHILNEQKLQQYGLKNLVSRKLRSYMTNRVHGIGEQLLLDAFAWNNLVPMDEFSPSQIFLYFSKICPEY